MAIKYIKFDKKNWFDANISNNKATINGAEYLENIQWVEVKAGTKTYRWTSNWDQSGSKTGEEQIFYMVESTPSRNEQVCPVIGVSDDYLIIGQMWGDNQSDWKSGPLWVKRSDCTVTQNGGVTSLLSHIWQALRAFTARKAVSAL